MPNTYHQPQDEELPTEAAPLNVAENLAAIAEYDGNLLDLVQDQKSRTLLGEETVREYDMDETSRTEWLESYRRALKATKQTPEAKNYPFEKASNIKYPVLTSACVQFNSRAYSAITRGDQPIVARPQGKDADGSKAKKSERVRTFLNNQLMYQCDEWDQGTDSLTMVLPMGGAGFRKCYWDRSLNRPVLEFATADKVVIANDAPSFDRAPRITQPVIYYPYEIKRMIDQKLWANHDYSLTNKSEDTQHPCEYLEQQRYIDLDGDGLQEPYIVTVHKESRQVVRIEPGFQIEGLKVGQAGEVETIVRESPLIGYYFLPSLDGSVYGMGFGQLLESLGGAVNTSLNQIIDAAHRQNAGGGFIAQGLKIRGGELRMQPSTFKFINAPSGNIRDAVYEPQFQGPSPVLFQTMEFLLGASQDITAVKDVLSGEAPSGQAMGATLALIEQGLQVFSTIYTRIYRSARKELKLLMRLNRRYLNPRVYAAFLDDDDLLNELLQKTGGAPAAMSAMMQPSPMGAMGG